MTFYRIWKLWQETGNVVSRRNTSHQTCLLDGSNIQYLNQLTEENPDYSLDELLSLLKTNCFISVHYTTIYNQFLRSSVSYKNFITSPLNEMKISVPTLLHAVECLSLDGFHLGNFSGGFIHEGFFFGLAGTRSGMNPLFFGFHICLNATVAQMQSISRCSQCPCP